MAVKCLLTAGFFALHRVDSPFAHQLPTHGNVNVATLLLNRGAAVDFTARVWIQIVSLLI